MQHLSDLSISIHSQSDRCGLPAFRTAQSGRSQQHCVYPCSEKRSLLEKCAQTALNSKLIAHQKEFFGEMAVDAVMSLEDDLNLKMIGVKKVAGGSLTDSVLVKGVAFKKTFSYAGFEQQVRDSSRPFHARRLDAHAGVAVLQPKKFCDPLICLLNVELELKSEKDNAEVRIKDVAVSMRRSSLSVLSPFG